MAFQLRGLLLLALAKGVASNLRGRRAATADECHTAVEGEQCYTAVIWAKEHGINLHPDWYEGLHPSSPFEAFQAHLHELNYDNCPAPCERAGREVCHTAVEGEECFKATKWAMDHGINLHPDWYPHLTSSSPFEAFQAHLFSLKFHTCPEPCPAYSTSRATTSVATTTEATTIVATTTEATTTVVTTTKATTTVATTTEATTTVVTTKATTTEATTTVATTSQATTTEATTTVATTTEASTTASTPSCSLSVVVYDSDNYYARKQVAKYSVPAGVCQRVPGSDSVYAMSTWDSSADMCFFSTLGHVKWYAESTCSGTLTSSMTIFTDGDTSKSGCKDALGNEVDGGNCQGRWAPYVPTTPTTTTTQHMCTLKVSVWTLVADPNNTYGTRKYLPMYNVKAGKCQQANVTNSVVYVKSRWPESSSWTSDCRHATLGYVDWYGDSKCSGSPTKTMLVYADGDTNRAGCRNDVGTLVDGAYCKGYWS